MTFYSLATTYRQRRAKVNSTLTSHHISLTTLPFHSDGWLRFNGILSTQVAISQAMRKLPRVSNITGCAVAQHCCNDDQQSQRENGEFDPL